MEQIWKYELTCNAIDGMDTTIAMPDGAEVLTAQIQGEVVVLWAKVRPAAAKIERHFRIVATGEPIDPEPMTFIATVQFRFGFVGHVFERNI